MTNGKPPKTKLQQLTQKRSQVQLPAKPKDVRLLAKRSGMNADDPLWVFVEAIGLLQEEVQEVRAAALRRGICGGRDSSIRGERSPSRLDGRAAGSVAGATERGDVDGGQGVGAAEGGAGVVQSLVVARAVDRAAVVESDVDLSQQNALGTDGGTAI